MAANDAIVQQQLHEKEATFNAMVDAIQQLAWMARPDGHIYWYNRRWYEYTGKTPAEMEGWGWQSVHDPEILPSVLQRWKVSLDTGREFEMEFPLRGADGRFRWFLTRIIPLKDEQGRVLRWFGTNTDIHEKVELVEERTRELTRYVSELEAFSYAAAHDLRAPVRLMTSFLQLAVREPAKAPEHMDRALAAAARMNETIDGLLNLARLTRQPLSPRAVDLGQVAEEIARTLAAGDRARAVSFRIEKPLEAWADETLVRVLLGNLLENAWKFTGKKASASIWLSRLPDGSFEVGDDGAGFDPRHAEKMFEPFHRLHAREDFGGHGLGLAICKRVVERHGGRLWAESAPGQGARFRFTLPRPGGR